MEYTDENKIKGVNVATLQQIIKHIQEEIAMLVPDYGEFLVLQIGATPPHQLFYTIDDFCPIEKWQKIERVILENAELLNLTVTTNDIE